MTTFNKMNLETLTLRGNSKSKSNFINGQINFAPASAPQTLVVGSGQTVNVNTYQTILSSSTAPATATLADGINGQLKHFNSTVFDGGQFIITLNGSNTITFADSGQYATMLFDNDNWMVVASGNTRVPSGTTPTWA